MEFFEILYGSIILIFSFDLDLYQIIFLSIKTSGLATVISSIFAIITAFFLVIYKSVLTKNLTLLLHSLSGIPPVVVGLIVYFIFSQEGPLGILSIIYTPNAIVIAQIIIVYPIISSLLRELFDEFWFQFNDSFRSLNITSFGIIYTFLKNNYKFILTIILIGFGRAISEIGAVMIVGGNIEYYTRVMTTAISLETRMGNLEKALSLGIVLIFVTSIINGLLFKIKKNKNN